MHGGCMLSNGIPTSQLALQQKQCLQLHFGTCWERVMHILAAGPMTHLEDMGSFFLLNHTFQLLLETVSTTNPDKYYFSIKFIFVQFYTEYNLYT